MTIGGGEAADQMVRMMLSGTEVAVRLGGSALKNLLALTMALAHNRKTLTGKVNMGKMLRETRDLRRFPMTPQLRQEVMKSEWYREQFAFLRDNAIATQADMTAFQTRTEETLANLTKQRTILNVRKKKRRSLYAALADVASLAQAKQLYEDGLSGMEAEYARYMDAVAVLEQCGIPRERLSAEKAEIYEQVAEINRQIRAERKKLALCREIQSRLPQMQQDINQIEEHSKEVERDERRRR